MEANEIKKQLRELLKELNSDSTTDTTLLLLFRSLISEIEDIKISYTDKRPIVADALSFAQDFLNDKNTDPFPVKNIEKKDEYLKLIGKTYPLYNNGQTVIEKSTCEEHMCFFEYTNSKTVIENPNRGIFKEIDHFFNTFSKYFSLSHEKAPLEPQVNFLRFHFPTSSPNIDYE